MILPFHSVTFGADPEVFLSKGREIIGAEKVLPKEGIKVETGYDLDKESGRFTPTYTPIVTIDGVQAEFNVLPDTCRQRFSRNLSRCFCELANVLPKGVSVDFSPTIEVKKKELESLSPENRVLGCSPSENIYENMGLLVADPSKFYDRSAGGHIHLGHTDAQTQKQLTEKRHETVLLLDILLGNTCVLLDTDMRNAERRKVYGRAGEFRAPAHGLEYRTLSNFWLRDYSLMSFVLAMARFAVLVGTNEEIKKEILDNTNVNNVRTAINENDFELARKNFDNIKEIVRDIRFANYGDPVYPLERTRLDAFETLVEGGIDKYFSPASVKKWQKHDYNTNEGWERFSDEIISKTVKKISKVSIYA